MPFFSAIDDSNGIELWKTDGTAAGTVMVKNASTLSPSDGSAPQNFAVLGDEVFYKFDDGSPDDQELWKSDGTAAGTKIVKNIAQFFGSFSLPTAIYTHNGKIYCNASDGNTGHELWQSDGTATGTKLVQDIEPNDGFYGSSPIDFVSLGKKLLFWAETDLNGRELWAFLPPISATASKTDVLCRGDSTGSILLTSDGAAPFSVQWSPAWVNGLSPTGLPAGVFSATLTDADGSTATVSTTIGQPAAALTTTFSATNAVGTMANGSATALSSGGVAPFSFAWATQPPQTTKTATDLAAGNWPFTVTDANGCTAAATATVGQTIPTIQLSAGKKNVACKGDSTGTITVTTNGLAPFLTVWSPSWAGNGLALTGLPAGVFALTLTDANTSTATLTVTITEPTAALAVVASSTLASSMTQADGTATVNPTGGTVPYKYLWNTSPAQTMPTATGLLPGIYEATVTDNQLCKATISVEVKTTSAATEPLFKSLRIAPNPTPDGRLELLGAERLAGGSILVLDEKGQLVAAFLIEKGQTGAFSIDLGRAAGLRLLVGKDASGRVVFWEKAVVAE